MEESKQEELLRQAHEARAVNLSESLLYPLLERKIQSQVSLIVSLFNGGETDFLKAVAQLASYQGIKEELKRIQQKGNKASEELNEFSRQS